MSCNSDYHDDINHHYYHGENWNNKNGTKYDAPSPGAHTAADNNKCKGSTSTDHKMSSFFTNSKEAKDQVVQRLKQVPCTYTNDNVPVTILELSPELQIQCLTYLHPRDVNSLGCCNRSCRSLIHGMNTNTEINNDMNDVKDDNNDHLENFSEVLWLHLWNRDYAHVLNSWDVAHDAMKQSLCNILSKKKKHNSLVITKKSIWYPCNNTHDASDLQMKVPKMLLSTIPSSAFPSFISKEKYISLLPSNKKSLIPIPTMQEFYLTFSQIWLNYTIAGRSTFNSCYTGLHGHVFNITNFVTQHPGAPESILLQGGGRDSTSFFEAVGHSLSARKIAVRELVEVVDLSCCSGNGDVGVHDSNNMDNGRITYDYRMSSPSSSSSLSPQSILQTKKYKKRNKPQWPLTGLSSTIPDDLSFIPKHRSRPKRTMGTLSRIRKKLKQSEEKVQVNAKKLMTKMKNEMVGKLNLYFDPFDGRWHGWYLNAHFETVFVHNLEQE